MNAIRTFTLSVFGLGLVGLASACEFSVAGETAVLYEMAPETQEQAWTSGQNLVIDGLNGEIELTVGEPGKVSVRFEPFTIRGSDERPEAEQEIADHLTRVIELDANGDVRVRTSADGGGSSIGSLIFVSIPPDFDGGIKVEQRNGDVDLQAVGAATSVEVVNDGAGDCLVHGATTVVSTAVTCGFDIEVLNVADHVRVRSTTQLEGGVRVELAAISAGAPDSSIQNDSGLVELWMPPGASYTVQAQANNGGTVDLGDLDAGRCIPDEASAGSKSMRCGTETDLPNYSVVAGEDGSEDGRVRIRYGSYEGSR